MTPTLATPLFATPLVVFDLPGMDEVNRELRALLVDESTRVPSWRRANVGGWHSAPDLGRRDVPALRALIQTIVDRVGDVTGALAAEAGIEQVPPLRYGVTAWAMVMRGGDYTTVHDHGDAHWSSAYYVDAGDDAPAPSGTLTFLDPRRSGRTLAELPLFPTTFDVPARTGALVVFPGWLQHHVHPYRGQRPRVAISCNVTAQVVPPGA